MNIITKIMHSNSQHMLLTLINNKIDYETKQLFQHDILLTDDLWVFSNSNNYLTFIDFIKGFISLTLSEFLISLSFSVKDRYSILFDLYDFVYNKFINQL